MSEICINKLISDVETGAQYIVLWIAPNNSYGYWYEMTGRSCKPVKFDIGNISSVENALRYEITDFKAPSTRKESDIGETEKAHRDRLWSMLKYALEYEPEIYERNSRAAILHKISDENSIEFSNLYPLLDRYWRSGKTKNAFIPAFYKRGNKGSVRNSKDRKIGRKPQNDISDGKIITETDRKYFESAVKSHFLNRNKATFTAVYEKLLADFYSISTDDNKSGHKTLMPPGQRPTLRQFRYWYNKHRDIETEQKKRDGKTSFELNGRAVTGRSDFGLMGPGAQFQIDATVGDIYLVSQFDRSNLIGRPVIYFIVDVFSRMVTGMSVGIVGPSWIGMAGAITNMVTDKTAYCKEYGIEITESEWSCHHLPSVLRGDRGELISKNADNLANVLGIRVENAPPYRADLKGVIEQHFRTINTNSVALLPGGVKPDMSKRGGHDYRLDAQLDIRQLTKILIKCVIYYNSHHYMDYFERTEAMIRDNVKAVPSDLWEWGIRNCSGALRSFPAEQVRLAVMPSDKAIVTEKGIRFKGLFYSSDRAVRESWFVKARSSKRWQISVSYDPQDMATVYVRNEDDNTYDVCSLLDWNGKNAGKCLDEIIYEQHKEKLVAKQVKSSEIEAKVNLNAEIEAIVAEAQTQSKKLPRQSNRKRVSNITQNRRNENTAMQNAATTAVDSAETEDTPVIIIADAEMSPALCKIRRKMEERLKNE